MSKRKILFMSFTLVAGIAITFIGAWLLKAKQLQDGFKNITQGMTKSEVEKTLGKPNEIETKKDHAWSSGYATWNDKQINDERSDEYAYHAPRLPQTYFVGFDSKGKVTSKCVQLSP